MGKSRRSGWRGGIGALAALAIASGVVVGMATAAEANVINSVAQLKASCPTGSGAAFIGVPDGSYGVCQLKSGYAMVCDDKKKGDSKCSGIKAATTRLVPTKRVPAPADSLSTQTVSDSWKQKMSVVTLTDVVCPSLGGRFVTSADGTLGACGTPTATIVCEDGLSDTNCVGFADSKKRADSIRKQVKTEVANAANTGTAPTTTPTTSPNAPPTTKTCPIGGCPPPTLPPGKAPGQSVPVVPPQNR